MPEAFGRSTGLAIPAHLSRGISIGADWTALDGLQLVTPTRSPPNEVNYNNSKNDHENVRTFFSASFSLLTSRF